MRHTLCDAQGNFVFGSVADGRCFVASVVWQQRPASHHGGVVTGGAALMTPADANGGRDGEDPCLAMKQAEAKRRIILEFDEWARREGIEHPNGTDGLRFFARMRSERPEMLAFGCRERIGQVLARSWSIGVEQAAASPRHQGAGHARRAAP